MDSPAASCGSTTVRRSKAARQARRGDAVARAPSRRRSSGCASRSAGRPALPAALYQGYPFDRLRRRLGLELVDAATVDPMDLGCAAPDELDRLDPLGPG